MARRRPGEAVPAVRRAAAWSGVAFVSLTLVLLAGAAQQNPPQSVPTGEELYVDRLGCWNCHGSTGEGGGAAGPAIAKTRLPLRRFLIQTRLPSGSMPPVAPILASDAELAIVYRWLEGMEAVEVPLPVSVGVKPSSRSAQGSADAQTIEIEFTVTRSEAKSGVGKQAPSLRISLYGPEGSPVTDRSFEYQAPGRSEWVALKTNESGEAVLPDNLESAAAGSPRTKAAPVRRLRVALPQGKHAVVVEVLGQRDEAGPAIIGMGSVVLTVQ